MVNKGLKIAAGRLSQAEQKDCLEQIRAVVRQAPFFQPVMPRTGKPFSVRMTNAGPLGWVSDRSGYRYQAMHPDTGAAWPAVPDVFLALWREFAGYRAEPECCLINYFGPEAKMGLHRDEDEEARDAPVVSLSLGDQALFRMGGLQRADPSRSFKLSSGDVLVLSGEARDCYHGVARIYPGTSTLLAKGGRINITLRRVTRPSD